MAWTLALSAVADLTAAAVYGTVASMLWARAQRLGSRIALRAFAVYWATTGLFLASSALVAGLAAAGRLDFGPALAHRYVGLALASAGLAGLLTYFAFLGTGDRRVLPLFVGIYSSALAYSWYAVWTSRPIGVQVKDWTVDVAYARPEPPLALFVALALYLVPPIAAAIWYLSVARRVTGVQRYRVRVVAIGILAQMAGIFAARVADADLVHVIVRPVMGITLALLVLSAYATPAWLEVRLSRVPSG